MKRVFLPEMQILLAIVATLFVVALSAPARADQATVYLRGCGTTDDRVELYWLVPAPLAGTHRISGTIGTGESMVSPTAIYDTWLQFRQAFQASCRLGDACYPILLDFNFDGAITHLDFRLLIDGWRRQPTVVGTHAIVPVMRRATSAFNPSVEGSASFPPASCVAIQYAKPMFDPLINLYAACVMPSGQHRADWNGGPTLVGPARQGTTTSACEGGRF